MLSKEPTVGERGVSELLMFMFVLTIGLTVTFGTFVYGVSELSSLSDDQSIEQAQTELEDVQSDFDALRSDAPLRHTELHLGDGSLEVDDSDLTEIQFTLDGPGKTETGTVETAPLAVQVDNRAAVFEHGAIVADENSGSAVLANPLFDIRDERTELPLFEISQASAGNSLTGGSATLVNYRSDKTVSWVDPSREGYNSPVTVTLVVESSRYRAWAGYFRSHSHDISVNVDENQERVEVQFETDEALLSVVETTAQFER